MRFNRTYLLVGLTLTASVALSACIPSVNGSVRVPAGGSRHNATTVNGSVRVGDGARVGSATTVNGSVYIGDDVTARSVKTVNGGVRIGSNTRVIGDVKTVNGGVHLSSGADISGDLATVNGTLRLNAVHVGGGVELMNGSLYVGTGSHIEGGIHVLRPRHDYDHWQHRRPRIVIGPGVTVDGTLRFDRDVKLYVSDNAIIGPVEGATPIRFSGDDPGDRETAMAPHHDRFSDGIRDSIRESIQESIRGEYRQSYRDDGRRWDVERP